LSLLPICLEKFFAVLLNTTSKKTEQSMAQKKRRRRRWYEVEKPTDPRLWLYGPVPAGFWQSSENRHLYMDWLGEQLGFTQIEDWYQITTEDFKKRRGGGLLSKFRDSAVALVKDYRPHYQWLEWCFTSAPQNFWDDRANQRRYLTWLGKQLGFRRYADWYQVTSEHFLSHYGRGILVKFHNSHIALLKALLPRYDWKEWLFVNVPLRFWQDPANRRRYLDWLGQQLGFTKPEDWYRIRANHIVENHGTTLFHQPDTTILSILKEYRPDYDWLEWRFVTVPDGFWFTRANRHRYLDWLGQQVGFTKPEDWYQLSTSLLQQWDGNRLLQKLGSPYAIVKDYFPHYPWHEWRFLQVPNGFWDARSNRRRYLDWVGEQLGFSKPEDWYQLMEQHLAQRHGSRLLQKFGYLPFAVVKDYLPRRRWFEWRFAKVPIGFWDDQDNRRRYLDWLGTQLRYRCPKDWMSLQAVHLKQYHGASFLGKFPLAQIVNEYVTGKTRRKTTDRSSSA
jgi:hypothetical protein